MSKVTLRELILHFIPDAPIQTRLGIVIAVASIRLLLERGALPDDPYTRTFNDWYASEASEGLR